MDIPHRAPSRGLLLAALACLLAPGLIAAQGTSAGPGACESPGGLALALRPDGPGAWVAVNGPQRLRVRVSGGTLRLSPADPGVPAWEFSSRLARDGDPGDLRESEAPGVLVEGGRTEIQRPRLDEWIENNPPGIEHGIEVRRAGESGLLYLDFGVDGSLFPKVSDDGRTVDFRDARGALHLRRIDLRAIDADGRDVGARWERIEGRHGGRDLRLVVHGADHSFPVRVTSVLTTPGGCAAAGSDLRGADPVPMMAPLNDLCAGAQAIPAAGPFPHLTTTVDVTDATSAGDPPLPSCQPNVSRSVWYAFTPAVTNDYSFSACAAAPTATTTEDTVLAVYAATGSCAGLVEVTGGCDDDSCAALAGQSVVTNVRLSAGTTYYIVAWVFGGAPPAPGAGSLQLLVDQRPQTGPAPHNDLCADAELIPGAGPFPYLTSTVADISGASTIGDSAAPSCQPFVSRSLWYSFTPEGDGRYAFSLCADAPTGTTVDDTVLAVYTGDCSALAELAAACDDDSCVGEGAQSVVHDLTLTAGVTYHVGVWQYDTLAPLPGNTAVQLRVSRVASPPNDTCTTAAALALDAPVRGSTVSALDDTRLAPGSPCFTGVGQTASTASGVDVAYGFIAPDAGKYSFRVSGYESAKNAVLYVSPDCPAGSPPATVTGCLAAANRSTVYPEEVKCLPLSAGQAVYLFVDENTPSTGSDFSIEVNACLEEAEPNDDPGSATGASCGMEGSIAPAGDADFFTLGAPAAGSRVFALVDGAAGNSSDFDLRVTTVSDTLEYDDLNNDVPYGAVAPNTSGTPLPGSEIYLRVSHYSATAQAEPYRLYAAIQPAAGTATSEIEPNDTIANATGGANQYYSGMLSSAGDVDIFSFPAAAGESIQIGLDLDPLRDATPFNGSLTLLDGSGSPIVAVNDLSGSSSTASGSGSLTSTTPGSPGEGIVHRVRDSGTYFVKVASTSTTTRDYLLSIAHGCRVGPATDIAVTQVDTPDPVPAGGDVTYLVAVRNHLSAPATMVVLRDDPPSGSLFQSATPSQGACAGSGPVICDLGTLAGGAEATVAITVRAPAAAGPIVNMARATMAVIDADTANDSASETTMVGAASDADGDGMADALDCAPADGTAWAVPGEATALTFTDGSSLTWGPPMASGGSVVVYDLLAGSFAADFGSAACLASGITSTTASAPSTPTGIAYYLVRSRNVCGGSLGAASDGTPRLGAACP